MNTGLTRRPLARFANGFMTGALLLAVAALPGANQAHADVLFSDDFTASTLNPAWQVLPGQGSYSVGGGDLRYYNQGPVAATTGWFNPALTLSLQFTGTDWEFDTKAAYHLDWLSSGSYTGPSTPNTSNSSGAQAPEVLVAFDSASQTSSQQAGTDYAAFERDIDAYYGSNILSASYGAAYDPNLLNPADSNINNNIADGTYWLQIIRSGGTLAMNYSYDGTTYMNAFTTTLANPTGTYNDLLLGGVTYSTAGSYTDYSYVTITTPSGVPEPGGLVPFGLCLAGIAMGCVRRKAASWASAGTR
ncbi:MAG: hypothetical protein LAP40_16740 [Acidobacteriia bacterium]|nr:hypothetical protein [Terriglobia bacterium]